MNIRFHSTQLDADLVQRADLGALPRPTEIEAVPFEATPPIAVAFCDGIGPEIMFASLGVLLAAGAKISIDPIDVGESVCMAGNSAGIDPKAWMTIRYPT